MATFVLTTYAARAVGAHAVGLTTHGMVSNHILRASDQLTGQCSTSQLLGATTGPEVRPGAVPLQLFIIIRCNSRCTDTLSSRIESTMSPLRLRCVRSSSEFESESLPEWENSDPESSCVGTAGQEGMLIEKTRGREAEMEVMMVRTDCAPAGKREGQP